jgi:hypothetical protein
MRLLRTWCKASVTTPLLLQLSRVSKFESRARGCSESFRCRSSISATAFSQAMANYNVGGAAAAGPWSNCTVDLLAYNRLQATWMTSRL